MISENVKFCNDNKKIHRNRERTEESTKRTERVDQKEQGRETETV